MHDDLLTASADNATPERLAFIKREISVGNLLLVLPMLGAIAAGLWEGGKIQATMQDGIRNEREDRITQAAQLNERISSMVASLNDVREDVRELRSYVMVTAQFPAEKRK